MYFTRVKTAPSWGFTKWTSLSNWHKMMEVCREDTQHLQQIYGDPIKYHNWNQVFTQLGRGGEGDSLDDTEISWPPTIKCNSPQDAGAAKIDWRATCWFGSKVDQVEAKASEGRVCCNCLIRPTIRATVCCVASSVPARSTCMELKTSNN